MGALANYEMPMYFFNLRRQGEVFPDPEGQEFPDMNAARTEAIEGARDLATDRVRSGEPINLAYCFEITDEAGQLQATIEFSEALDIIGNEAIK